MYISEDPSYFPVMFWFK